MSKSNASTSADMTRGRVGYHRHESDRSAASSWDVCGSSPAQVGDPKVWNKHFAAWERRRFGRNGVVFPRQGGSGKRTWFADPGL